jgi:multidrug transporter EmrE-like cation transporter
MTLILWIAFGMISFGVGEYFSKKYADTSLKSFGIFAWFGWIISSFCFLPSITRYNSLSILGTMWNILYVLITLSVGLIIFREPVTTTQAIGLVLGVIAIVLLTI